MKMIVPDILISRWLVVLPSGNSRALVGYLHRTGNDCGNSMDGAADLVGQIVKILVMSIRHDQNVAGIPWPLP